MIVKGLNIQNFRNIEKAYIEPAEGVNVIFGENAGQNQFAGKHMAVYGL